jgi:dTDP-4-amino-4,6-dideoxygalactose transaminase
MISDLKNKGYSIKDPWDVVKIFEERLAEYAGSDYAVCVDSCSHAIFLCLKYLKIKNKILTIPKNTYVSVPSQCIHSGNRIVFQDQKWSGIYQIQPTNIFDAATRFRKNMYINDSYFCISFHHRKILKIGRGGAILTNDKNFVDWLRPMIYDGRHIDKLYHEDVFEVLGYHMYMTPEEAAKGLLLLDNIDDYNEDVGSDETYTDLTLQPIFRKHCE